MNKVLILFLSLAVSLNLVGQQTIKSKLGDWGIYTGNWNSIAPDLKNNGKKLVDDKSIDVVSFLWWIISENSDFQTIASNLYKSIQFGKNSQFSTGKYIYVINEKITGKKSKGKPIEFWPVYIVPITSAPPNSTFKVGTSPVLSMEQYTSWKSEFDLFSVVSKGAVTARPESESVMGYPRTKKIVVEELNVNETCILFFRVALAPEPTVSDFNALKKDPDSEIQRLDIEIENQENKIAEFKKVSDQLLLKPYTELKNSHTVLNSKIKVLNDIDSTKRSIRWNIDNYKASQKDLENYNILKSIKLFTNVTTDKKANQFIEKLRKFYGVSNRLLFSENQIYEYTKGLRIETLEVVELNEKDLKKYKKLQANQSFKIIEDQKKVIKKLTGLDSNYFELIDEVLKVDEEYSSNYEEFLEMKSNYNYLNEAYKNLYDSKIDELQLLDDKKDELRLLRKTYSGKKQFLESKKKYPTIKCGDIMISKVFLEETHFRNGDALRKARSPSEWDRFCEEQIPCYMWVNKGITSNEATHSVLYNYFAIIDERIIAPKGFHLLTLKDYKKSTGKIPGIPGYSRDRDNAPLYNLDFSKKQRIECDKRQSIYEKCNKCSFWSEEQRKHKPCAKCKNRRNYDTGKYETCTTCNGKGYIYRNYGEQFKAHIISDYDVRQLNYDEWRPNECYELEFRNGRFLDPEYYMKSVHLSFTKQYRIFLVEDNYSYPKCENEKLSKGGIEFMNHLLDVTTFQNGDPIKLIEDPVEWELAIIRGTPAYCYYENNPENPGCIYNIHAWNDKRGLIPSGWRDFRDYDNFSLGSEYQPHMEKYASQSKTGVPFINFIEQPYMQPKGIRKNDGSFSDNSSVIQSRNFEARLSEDFVGYDRDRKMSFKVVAGVKHLNFGYRRYEGSDDMEISGYLIPFGAYPGSYPTGRRVDQTYGGWEEVSSGYVILCRDVKE